MQYNDKKINQLMLKLAFGVLLAGVVLVSISVFNVLQKKKEVSKEVKALENENIAMEEKRSELNNLLDYFQDQSFIEKEARRKLNMQKIGERAVIIINKSGGVGLPASVLGADSGLTVGENGGDLGKSNQHKWLDYIFR